MGYRRGQYEHLHPNTHVNMAQSTNDVYPTAMRLAMVLKHNELIVAAKSLKNACEVKSEEFKSILKMGRTQLQGRSAYDSGSGIPRLRHHHR